MTAKGDPQWAMRRRVIHATLISCLGLSVYAVSHSPEMAMAVFPHTALLAGAVVGSYVFGAEWGRIKGTESAASMTEETSATRAATPGAAAEPLLPSGPPMGASA